MLTSYDNDEFLYPYINENDFNQMNIHNQQQQLLLNKPYYLEEIKGESIKVPSWRMKEKMKTVSAALVMCLNIGVDPPDIEKSNQSSKIECWINQLTVNPQKTLETIGAELQKQYERWQPRARYKQCLDPTTEEVKKLCISLRKNAKDDRVLFHYNGHGVPKPTTNGEIWVFNKEFTQYIPLSLYEVQTWMATPSLYVWDCSNAGVIIQSFLQFENDRENELTQRDSVNSSATMHRIRDSIHLAACGVNESLPLHPNLPTDLFTACLTTPIKAALYWYVSQKHLCKLIPGLTYDLLDKIPGQINDRRTMLGELNWIFTAITDTIAWNVLETELFQKLFRQDLLVASLFRNYLLAERIMKSLDCNPISSPFLPSTYEHPLWQSWDLALDMCISQLPAVLNDKNPKEFVSCGFFSEQIDAFAVWLRYNINSKLPPEQLPVVLQVLLSQQHRLKALELLCNFLDFGAWAVSAALSVGIFPYVLKLLTTQPRELRSLLTFIWAKILAVDKSCQTELVKDCGHEYFINVLADSDCDTNLKVNSAFVLSCIVDNFQFGKESCKQKFLIQHCYLLINDRRTIDYKNPLLRKWCCICLALCWKNYPNAKWEAIRSNIHKTLLDLVHDSVAEVRAAAIFALSTLIECAKGDEGTDSQIFNINSEIIGSLIKKCDSVPIVRKELIIGLYNFMLEFDNNFTQLAATSAQLASSISSTSLLPNQQVPFSSSSSSLSPSSPNTVSMNPSLSSSLPSNEYTSNSPSVFGSEINNTQATPNILNVSRYNNNNNLFNKVWNFITDLQRDPYPDVSELAQKVILSFSNLKRNYSITANGSNNTNHCNKRDRTIQTEFVQWSSSHFLKPLLPNQKQNADDYTSELIDQRCKLLYNYKVRAHKPLAWRDSQTMDEILVIKHTTLPFHCKFHPYDDLVFFADKDCNINIYDVTKAQTKTKICNITSKRVSKITSFKLLNAQYEPLILTGTDDYVVRLFKPDLLHNKKNKLLTAFNAFNKNEKENSSFDVGFVTEYNETQNNLLCAGDTKCIRIWDMNSELYKDYSTDIKSGVCSLSSDELTVAGFGDGKVRSFDFRTPSNSNTTIKYEHNSFVLKVFLHKNTNKLVSASIEGDIKIIDLRKPVPIANEFTTSNNESATAIECHPINELIAIANSNQTIKIYDFKLKELATIKHHEGFLGKRIASVLCLDWNYYKNEIVFGSQDQYLSIFTCRESQAHNTLRN